MVECSEGGAIRGALPFFKRQMIGSFMPLPVIFCLEKSPCKGCIKKAAPFGSKTTDRPLGQVSPVGGAS